MSDNLGVSFKRQKWFLIILCGGLFVLNSIVFKPIYMVLNDYYMYMIKTPVIVTALSFLIELCYIATYASAFAFVIYSVFLKMPKRKSMNLIWIYMLVAFISGIINLVAIIFVYKAVSFDDMISELLYLIYEFIQLIIVYAISSSTFNKYYKTLYIENRKTAKNAAFIGVIGNNFHFLSFNKIYDPKNPLQKSTMLSAAFFAGLGIVSRIIYDIFYGLPQSLIEVLSMVLFYTSDILVGVVIYAVVMFTITKILAPKDISSDKQN